jgi:HD-GYP domain-containing protein (c-di-GMP phosphodiesterase class II)
VAFAARGHPAAVLITLPMSALLMYFARERQARMQSALELSRAFRGTALLLGDVVEADDEYTGVHSRDVVDLCMAVGPRLSLDEDQLRRLELTALLHDVGKIAIPKEIINKPGKLTDEERATIETHTIEGEAMLERVGASSERSDDSSAPAVSATTDSATRTASSARPSRSRRGLSAAAMPSTR